MFRDILQADLGIVSDMSVGGSICAFGETFDESGDGGGVEDAKGGASEEEMHCREEGGVVFFNSFEEFVLRKSGNKGVCVSRIRTEVFGGLRHT